MDADRARSLLEDHRESATRIVVDEGDALAAGVRHEVLTDVEAALVRLDAGTYGTCETCGERIPDERLELVPWTRFCLADEQRWELGLAAEAPVDDVEAPAWSELDEAPDEEDEEVDVHWNEEDALHVEDADGWMVDEAIAALEDAEGTR